MSKTPPCFTEAMGTVFPNCVIYNPSGILFSQKKNAIVLFGVRQIYLEIIMPIQVNQAQNDKNYMFSVTCDISNS